MSTERADGHRGRGLLIAVISAYVIVAAVMLDFWLKPHRWNQADQAAETSASTPAKETPTPAPAAAAPEPAAPKNGLPPSGTAPYASFASWVAPVALGLSTFCTIGLVVMGLRMRRSQRHWLEFESYLRSWPSQFEQSGSRHDDQISRLGRDIDGVRTLVTDLEASFTRYKTSAARTQSQHSLEPGPPRARGGAATDFAEPFGAGLDVQSADPPAAESAFEATAVTATRAVDREYGYGSRRRSVEPAADGAPSAKVRFYAGMPGPQGTFPAASVTPAPDGWSLYEIEPLSGPVARNTRARLVLYQATRVHAAALSSHRECLMPVCEYDGPPLAEHTAIKMALPGEVRFDGEQWQVTRKMKIKFIA